MTSARAVPDLWTGDVTDHIVVGDRILLHTSFRAARAQQNTLLDGEVARARRWGAALGVVAGDAYILARS
jgi:hypothetical protein